MTMEARNRPLPQWLNRICTGQLVLPRFQRHESWDHNKAIRLLDSILRGRPIGAALVLAIGDNEPFASRQIAGAPERSARVNEHLLDGQQRLTALWKALTDGYDERTYFVVLHPESEEEPLIKAEARWQRDGQRYPLWVDQPREQLKRGLIPMSLLNPDTTPDKLSTWCDSATDSIEESRNVQNLITPLQANIRAANLPYLELPVTTPPHEAIDVFVNMNTTAAKLTMFDIIVAQFEERTGESLHDMEESLRATVPSVVRYDDDPDLILRVAALRKGRPPTEAAFMALDLLQLWDERESIKKGIEGAIHFLEEEHIFDQERLPTVAVLPVLAAIWGQMAESLDAHGTARTVLRRYLWRSFFTNRYERSAATAAFQDYRGLMARLVDGKADASIPVLDDEQFPIVGIEEIERAPWPRRRNTLARGILAVSLRGGGRDFADDTPAGADSIRAREYHHLFPVALLGEKDTVDGYNINLALNCALVTWNTNRHISAKAPVDYLRERVEHAERALSSEAQRLGEDQIRSRVSSHTIPFEQLNVGGYDCLAGDQRQKKIRADYERFIRARAEAVHRAVLKLCNGEEWHGL